MFIPEFEVNIPEEITGELPHEFTSTYIALFIQFEC
jgi:hypothetical protein